HHAVATDDPALVADPLDRRPDLHFAPCFRPGPGLAAPRPGRPSDDPALAVVDPGRFHEHLISGREPRQEGARVSREMRRPPLAPCELHSVHGVRKAVPHHRGPDLRRLVHRTVITSAPVARIATVCSKWAERLPSRVTTVQSSSSTRTSGPPALT